MPPFQYQGHSEIAQCLIGLDYQTRGHVVRWEADKKMMVRLHTAAARSKSTMGERLSRFTDLKASLAFSRAPDRRVLAFLQVRVWLLAAPDV